MPGGNAHEGVCIASGVAAAGGCEWRNKNGVRGDNPNTQQIPEYTKDKYNGRIIKRKSLIRSHQQPI
jgi:hypothetical protein